MTIKYSHDYLTISPFNDIYYFKTRILLLKRIKLNIRFLSIVKVNFIKVN